MEQIRGNPRDLGQNFLPFYLSVLHISVSEDSQSSAMCNARIAKAKWFGFRFDKL
jgi:hypothetical protein